MSQTKHVCVQPAGCQLVASSKSHLGFTVSVLLSSFPISPSSRFLPCSTLRPAPRPASWESSGQRSKLTVTSSLPIPVNKALSLTCSFFLPPVCVIRSHLSSDNKRCAVPWSRSLSPPSTIISRMKPESPSSALSLLHSFPHPSPEPACRLLCKLCPHLVRPPSVPAC